MFSNDTTSSDHSLRRLYEQILIAWNQQGAAAIAARFAEDGNLVGFDGSQADSRAAIEDHLRPIFAYHPPRPTLQRWARFGYSAATQVSFARLLG